MFIKTLGIRCIKLGKKEKKLELSFFKTYIFYAGDDLEAFDEAGEVGLAMEAGQVSLAMEAVRRGRQGRRRQHTRRVHGKPIEKKHIISSSFHVFNLHIIHVTIYVV